MSYHHLIKLADMYLDLGKVVFVGSPVGGRVLIVFDARDHETHKGYSASSPPYAGQPSLSMSLDATGANWKALKAHLDRMATPPPKEEEAPLVEIAALKDQP